jgi:hypothetical protein
MPCIATHGFCKANVNKKLNAGLSVVLHVCNPSYSGGGGRILSLRPAQAKLGRACLKNKTQTKGV